MDQADAGAKRSQMEKSPPYQYDLSFKGLTELLPPGPGVYLFKDDSGQVLYVGKAKSLRKRVASYLRPAKDLPHKTSLMMKRAKGLDFVLTSSEKEALILESTLIKKYLPRYNIVLRDDSQYPCLRLSIQDDFPRLSIARRIKRDGARYFGPFSSAKAVRDTLKVIDKVFQLRKCKGKEVKIRPRPCLNYQMGRCLAPCSGKVASIEYKEVVEQVILFLEGRNRELIKGLEGKMKEAAEALEFEKAARIRDQIQAIERTVERQHVVSTRMENQDVIGLAGRDGFYQLVVLSIRNGYLISSRDYSFRAKGESASEIMEAFLKQYYFREGFVPQEVLISEPVEDVHAIQEWLAEMAGRKVELRFPRKGEKLKLVHMAVSNAENLLNLREAKGETDIIERAQGVLGLKRLPRSIEALDISNFQGDLAVGTIVSFVDGKPERSGYRNYRIRTISGIDDYGMLAELTTRRLSQGRLPDLFLIDGGRGQLSAVKRVLDCYEGEDRPEVVALAKADVRKGEPSDKVYTSHTNEPIVLSPHDPVLLFLMRIRDEAHRRAIGYHRKLREKGLTASILGEIPGVGEKRAKSLLSHFKSLQDIKKATEQDLVKVEGITRPVAQQIVHFFKENT